MKKIEAVIIPSQLDAVRLAGERGGICGKLTLTEVQQRDANPLRSVLRAVATIELR